MDICDLLVNEVRSAAEQKARRLRRIVDRKTDDGTLARDDPDYLEYIRTMRLLKGIRV